MFLSKNGGIYFSDDTAEAETSKMCTLPQLRDIKKVSGENILAYLYFFKIIPVRERLPGMYLHKYRSQCTYLHLFHTCRRLR